MRYYSSIAPATIVTNVSGLTSGTTTLSLASQAGMPTSFPFVLRFEGGTANEELVNVLSGAGTLATPYVIVRGFDSTSAKAHANGAAVTHAIIAKDLREMQDFMQHAQVDVMVQYGAVGDGATDDQPAIQAALNAVGPGGTVYLPGGYNFGVASPLKIPPGVRLKGTRPSGHVWHDDFLTIKGGLIGLGGFVGSSVIKLEDQALAGWSSFSRQQVVENITITGWFLPANVSGITLTGIVQNVVLQNLLIQGVTGAGVWATSNGSGVPGTLTMESVAILEAVAEGFRLRADDCQIMNCSTGDAGANGWYLQGCTNSQFQNCRSEHSGQNGFYITGDWYNSGVVFSDCTTDANKFNGVWVDARTSTGAIGFTGLSLRRDGRNSGAGGGGYAAFKVSNAAGVTNPVHVNGLTVYPGIDDNGTGTPSPQYGISVDHATYLEVNGGYIHAANTNIFDGGNNAAFIVNAGAAYGTVASPSRTRLSYNDRVTTGGWYHAVEGSDAALVTTQSRLLLYPFNARARIVDQIAAEVTVAAASSVLRLGVYLDNGNGRPGNLLADFGTVSSASTGVKAIDVSQELIPGLGYYLAFVTQGGAPTLNAANPPANKFIQLGTSTPASLANVCAYYQSSIAGALPASFTYTAGQVVAVMPRISILWGA